MAPVMAPWPPFLELAKPRLNSFTREPNLRPISVYCPCLSNPFGTLWLEELQGIQPWHPLIPLISRDSIDSTNRI